MARKLGEYLKAHAMPVNPEDVVIYSSPMLRCVETARGIAEGLGHPELPIHVEESLVEEIYWMEHDIHRNRAAVEGETFLPLWRPREELKEAVPSVATTVREPFSPVTVEMAANARLTESPRVDYRCRRAVASMMKQSHEGTVLILVGHGTTTREFARAFINDSLPDLPDYTSFVDLHLTSNPEDKVVGLQQGRHPYRAVGEVFGTPHLDPHRED